MNCCVGTFLGHLDTALQDIYKYSDALGLEGALQSLRLSTMEVTNYLASNMLK